MTQYQVGNYLPSHNIYTHTHTCMMYFLVFTFYNSYTLVFVTIFQIHIHDSFIDIYMMLCFFPHVLFLILIDICMCLVLLSSYLNFLL